MLDWSWTQRLEDGGDYKVLSDMTISVLCNGGPDDRGQGLFASRDIKKGELTHDGTSSNVPFPDAAAWRRFVFSLPRNRACDILDWTWTQKLNEDGEYGIFSALDISVLHNGGRGAGANVNPKSPTSSKFEELLTDYLIYDTVWSKVGL